MRCVIFKIKPANSAWGLQMYWIQGIVISIVFETILPTLINNWSIFFKSRIHPRPPKATLASLALSKPLELLRSGRCYGPPRGRFRLWGENKLTSVTCSGMIKKRVYLLAFCVDAANSRSWNSLSLEKVRMVRIWTATAFPPVQCDIL